jgi:hypothetical protein
MAALVVSYARVDRAQIREIVDLLTASHAAEKAVFWDGHLVAGDNWFNQLKRHINKAGRLFVFWCLHSGRSRQVRREYLYAIKRKKRVIPVLLDNTPLSRELSPIHGIDMRASIRHARPRAAPAKAKGPISISRKKKAGKTAESYVVVDFGTSNSTLALRRRMLKPMTRFTGTALTTPAPRLRPVSVFKSPAARAATVKQFRKFLTEPDRSSVATKTRASLR